MFCGLVTTAARGLRPVKAAIKGEKGVETEWRLRILLNKLLTLYKKRNAAALSIGVSPREQS
jgi:hypothetical protein